MTILIEHSPELGEKPGPEDIVEIDNDKDDKEVEPTNYGDLARSSLANVLNSTKKIRAKYSTEGESKKSGGGRWWFSPCIEHSTARYLCCTGGRCESWKKD